MQIQVNFGDIDHSDPVAEHVNASVESALARFADRITRVEVHLRDDKSGRKGPDDHRCLMEARLAGEKPLAVDAKAMDIYQAISECAAKLEHAVRRKVERQ